MILKTWQPHTLLGVCIGTVEIAAKTVLVESASFFHADLSARAIELSETLVRNLNVTVEAINGIGSSAESLEVEFSNPVHPAPHSIAQAGTFPDNDMSWECDIQEDFLTFKIYGSDTSGFTPDGSTLLDTITDKFVTIHVAPSAFYFLRVAALDVWGNELSLSDEYEIV